MSESEITELLKKLQVALESEGSISAKDRALLEQLSLDIRGLLERRGGAADAGQQTTLDQLQDAVTRFEVSHPDITGVLAAVSRVLGDMGI